MTQAHNRLLTLQQDFTSHILEKENEKILESLPYSKQEALARLNVYRNNVVGNFESVLASIYEAVQKIVGEQYFEQLVQLHIQKYPSRSGNLDNYGINFPRIIKNRLKEHKLLYLEDVAKLELLYHKSYFVKEPRKSFDIERFQRVNPERYENIVFKLHPSCFLMESPFPIFDIWKYNNEDSQDSLNISDNPQYCLVHRVENSSIINNLTHEEFLFLSYCKGGDRLYESYEKINKITGKEVDIGAFLNKFISNGIFINFNITRTSI